MAHVTFYVQAPKSALSNKQEAVRRKIRAQILR